MPAETTAVPARGSIRSRSAAAVSGLTLRPVSAVLPPERAWGLWTSRQIVARIMDSFGPPLAGTRVEPVDVRLADGRRVKGEWVRGPNAVAGDRAIYFVHGSGFALCSPRTHRRLTAWLSRLTGLPVFCLDYRLAPEHRFPAAPTDVRTGWDWLCTERGLEPDRVVIAGDSAGGHLAVDLLLQPDVDHPAGLALLSPLIDLTFALSRAREALRRDPAVRAQDAAKLIGLYCAGTDLRRPQARRRHRRSARTVRTAGVARPGARVPGATSPHPGGRTRDASGGRVRHRLATAARRRTDHTHHDNLGEPMAIDMDAMLAKIKDRQWALADIDWDAPGAELITDEMRPKLKAFMADLCWIENVGARGFAALAKKAPTPTLAEIYRYFHAEEQRHANAELALMKRWGMLDDGEMPEPNVNIRLAIDWLDTYADDMSLSILGTVIPMLEVALDGALLKFLLEEVHDPVCHQVFEKINNDESRHIAVDFEVLEMIGQADARRLLVQFVGNVATPGVIIGAIMYVPLLNRMRNNIVDMGLQPEKLYTAMMRFKTLGERGESTWRVPTYQVLKLHARMVVKPNNPYHWLANPMVWASDYYPRRLLKPIPTWFKELTHEPAA